MKTLITLLAAIFISSGVSDRYFERQREADLEAKVEAIFKDPSPLVDWKAEPEPLTEKQERILSEVVALIIRTMIEVDREANLVVTFNDGTVAEMPLPRFSEFLENVKGDLAIIKGEIEHSVRIALEMGAAKFEVFDMIPEDKGTAI